MDALSCLAPPHAALLLPCAAAFTDADITRALHFSSSSSSSMPDPSSGASSSAAFLAAAYGSGGFVSAPPSLPAITCESVLVADTARPSPSPAVGRRHQQHQLGLGPAAGGRAGKRRSRASKRAPTTYISTDPANFRLMVQHVTGVQADIPHLPTTAAPFDAASLLDSTTAAAPAGHLATAAFANPLPLLLQAEHYQQQHEQPCFPTLDSSWGALMYEEVTDHLL